MRYGGIFVVTTYVLMCSAVVVLLILTASGKMSSSERVIRILFVAFNFLIASGVALALALMLL